MSQDSPRVYRLSLRDQSSAYLGVLALAINAPDCLNPSGPPSPLLCSAVPPSSHLASILRAAALPLPQDLASLQLAQLCEHHVHATDRTAARPLCFPTSHAARSSDADPSPVMLLCKRALDSMHTRAGVFTHFGPLNSLYASVAEPVFALARRGRRWPEVGPGFVRWCGLWRCPICPVDRTFSFAVFSCVLSCTFPFVLHPFPVVPDPIIPRPDTSGLMGFVTLATCIAEGLALN